MGEIPHAERLGTIPSYSPISSSAPIRWRHRRVDPFGSLALMCPPVGTVLASHKRSQAEETHRRGLGTSTAELPAERVSMMSS